MNEFLYRLHDGNFYLCHAWVMSMNSRYGLPPLILSTGGYTFCKLSATYLNIRYYCFPWLFRLRLRLNKPFSNNHYAVYHTYENKE